MVCTVCLSKHVFFLNSQTPDRQVAENVVGIFWEKIDLFII